MSVATCRRDFLKGIGASGASWIMAGRAMADDGDGKPGEAKHAAPTMLLSTSGSDRATAYVMSNKVARRGRFVVCTWLAANRQNRWALVDPATRKILREGTVGKPLRDNHCGAAMATDTDGTLHLLTGAHFGSFGHYRMRPGADDWEAVPDGAVGGQHATYPSLVCDGKGTLHVTYRVEQRGHRPAVYYCRRPRRGRWSEPRELVRAAVREHSWTTNAIEVGPKGRLHLVVSNTLPFPKLGAPGRYYGAAHLYSDDAGVTWRQFADAGPLPLPAQGETLKRIESDGLPPERIEPRYGGPPGPLNSYYHKILASNAVIDDRRRPWVIVHNLLDATANLYRHEDVGGWVGIALRPHVARLLPGFDIRHCGQLSRHGDGTIEAVLMVAPASERGWGSPGTELVRLLVRPDATIAGTELVRTPDPAIPHWLPSLERWCPHAPIARPALLHTRGLNAGGYSHNRNRLNTEVWLQLP